MTAILGRKWVRKKKKTLVKWEGEKVKNLFLKKLDKQKRWISFEKKTEQARGMLKLKQESSEVHSGKNEEGFNIIRDWK